MRLYGRVGALNFKSICSQRTSKLREQVLRKTFRLIRENNRGIKTLDQFKPRLIPQILELWSARDVIGGMRLSHETQVQEFSILRWFWKIHGIKVGPIKGYVEELKERQKFTRHKPIADSKHGVDLRGDVKGWIEAARHVDPVVARLMEHACGLGNRAASLKTRVESEVRAAIEAVRQELSAKQYETWLGRTSEEARKHFSYVLYRIGLSKKEAGLTFSGLKVLAARVQFETMVTGETDGASIVDYGRFVESRRAIAKALGLERIRQVAPHYIEFFRMSQAGEGRFLKSWARLAPLLHDLLDRLNEHEIDNLWLVGRRASGADDHRENETFEFLVDERVDVIKAATLAGAFAQDLEMRLGAPVAVQVSSMHGEQAKLAWAKNALPLFRPDGPRLNRDQSASAY